MSVFFAFLKQKRWSIVLGICCGCMILTSVYLFDLPLQVAAYPLLLCLLPVIFIWGMEFHRLRLKHSAMMDLAHATSKQMASEQDLPEIGESLPEADNLLEQDYRKLVCLLEEESKERASRDLEKYGNMMDYYTVWAHQIKTPIAAMRIKLQNEDTSFARELRSDLNRIEGYVNMVMTYLRLDAEQTDYLIKAYDLDEILRSSVQKFAGDFIGKRLSLTYEPVKTQVITDAKWMSFVVEQVLSNAVKYTRQGGVSIYLQEEEDRILLCIEDTGIGIAPEDLPRIFENGYTGFNGRSEKRSSGIGLYLCKRICDRLGHEITAISGLGEGTKVLISFGKM